MLKRNYLLLGFSALWSFLLYFQSHWIPSSPEKSGLRTLQVPSSGRIISYSCSLTHVKELGKTNNQNKDRLGLKATIDRKAFLPSFPHLLFSPFLGSFTKVLPDLFKKENSYLLSQLKSYSKRKLFLLLRRISI